MSIDDINDFSLNLYEFMYKSLGIMFEDEEYDILYNFILNELDPFITKERNYN